MALEKLSECMVGKRMRRRGVVARGNPYDVVRTRGGYGVKNTEKGTYRSKGTSKKKAMAQFRLLEAVEHSDWRPTRRR